MVILAIGLMANSRGNRLRKTGGFSLLEVMVVLVIISIVISFAAMSFDTGSEKLDNEEQRLTALMQLASEEAIMSSREYRVVFTVNSYAFAKLADGEWQEIEAGVFRSRELPGDFGFDLTLGHEPVDLAGPGDEETPNRAAILFLSSGEVTPFEVVIKSSNGKERTISNQSGIIGAGSERP